MKHIHIVAKGKSVAGADAGLKSIGCSLCLLKNRGDRNACESSGKCAIILTPP